MKLNQYYKIGEAAIFLGVSRNTLRNWENSGKLQAKRSPGGYRLYTRDQLEEVLRGVRDFDEAVKKGLDECRQGKIVKETIDLEKFNA